MRLSRLVIENFRRIRYAEIQLEPASFLIGQNNYGKSSVVKAIELLLSQLAPSLEDFRKDPSGTQFQEIRLTGTFTGVDNEVANARGFKGRVINGQFTYRKTYNITNPGKPLIECLEYPYTIKSEFENVKTGEDLLKLGVPEDRVRELVQGDFSKRLRSGWERDLLDIVADFDMTAEPEWKQNPGGIPGNVLSKLPRVVHIPPLTDEADISQGEKNTKMAEVLGILFEDLLAGNPLATTLEQSLAELQKQMSPDDEASLIAQLCKEINEVISSVFPGCGIRIDPELQDLHSVLRPKYTITMFSNVRTDVSHQGSGLLRTAIFSMLRYHAHLKATKEQQLRPLLVAFEEPELYLHPSAANLLRDTIYALGQTDQIVCTTHSPWMIDLSKDWQSLTKMVLEPDDSVTAVNYGISRKLLSLDEDDRSRVKMLQYFDDEMSRVFFSERVVIVEGDSEVLVMKKTLDLLPDSIRKDILSRLHIVKARGKAAIASLVKYFHALSIKPFVIHDRDAKVPGSESLNERIAVAVGDPSRIAVLDDCLENVLGYNPPAADKPYRAYLAAATWASLDDVPRAWLEVFGKAVGIDLEPLLQQGDAPLAKPSDR